MDATGPVLGATLPSGLSIASSGEIATLNAQEYGAAWPQVVEDAFCMCKHATGKWPTALVVRNVPRPSAFSLLEPPCLWGAVAARDLKSSMVSVHDQDLGIGFLIPIEAWAQLRRVRDAFVGTDTGPSSSHACAPPQQPGPPTAAPGTSRAQAGTPQTPACPAGVDRDHWETLLRGRNILYLSAAEAQQHAPEIAAAFDSHAEQACLMRYLPKGALWEQNFGPIIMDAEAGSSSGWHRDGSPTELSKAGDVNAFHWHVVGNKTWKLFPERYGEIVSKFMARASENVFGNKNPTAGQLSEFLQINCVPEPIEVKSEGGTVLVVGKRVWHSVTTVTRSVSVTADRILMDHLDLHLPILDSVAGRPLVPAKWAAHEAAAAIAALVAGGAPSDKAAWKSVTALKSLRHARPFLGDLLAREPPDQGRRENPPMLSGGSACVSCERDHASVRYCHGCGTELYNGLYECSNADCPWEGCQACAERFGAPLIEAIAPVASHLSPAAAGPATAAGTAFAAAADTAAGEQGTGRPSAEAPAEGDGSGGDASALHRASEYLERVFGFEKPAPADLGGEAAAAGAELVDEAEEREEGSVGAGRVVKRSRSVRGGAAPVGVPSSAPTATAPASSAKRTRSPASAGSPGGGQSARRRPGRLADDDHGSGGADELAESVAAIVNAAREEQRGGNGRGRLNPRRGSAPPPNYCENSTHRNRMAPLPEERGARAAAPARRVRTARRPPPSAAGPCRHAVIELKRLRWRPTELGRLLPLLDGALAAATAASQPAQMAPKPMSSVGS